MAMTAERELQKPGHCGDCPVRDLTLYSVANFANAAEIYELRRGVRSIRARDNIYVEGRRLEEFLTLYDGWAFRYRVLPGGTRQIFSFLLPGDSVSLSALVSETLPFSVDALTDCVVCVFDRAELSRYIEAHRPLVRKAWRSCSHDQNRLHRRLVEVGRRSAYQRVAHLAMECYDRLAHRGMAEADSFPFPLRHPHVADALGLTPIHVSRVFRELEADGVLRRRDRRIEIGDMDRLRELQALGGDGFPVDEPH